MKRHIVAFAVCVALGGLSIFGASAAGAGGIQPIEDDSACPVAGCVADECHAGSPYPEPDGSFTMTCPKRGCVSTECHAWSELTGHYNAPSDMSLNLWLMVPTVLVVVLVLVVGSHGRKEASDELEG